MASAKIYNMNGETVGNMELPNAVFSVKANPALVHQVIVAIAANKRVPYAHTKTRGEVRGGGKKPWRQKGTGRARQGSIRSPQWVGGGRVFGPRKERSYEQKINKKMKQKALLQTLTDKAEHEKILVLDRFEFQNPKTKEAAMIMKKLPLGKSTLVVLPSLTSTITRAVRNLPKVMSTTSANLGITDVVKYDTLLTTVDGIKSLESRFAK